MAEKKRDIFNDDAAVLLSNTEAAAVRGGGGTIKPKVDDGDADGISG